MPKVRSRITLTYELVPANMEQPEGKDYFETTADRLGMVFRTKAELYYFLTTTCIFPNQCLLR